ncbi:MAG: hypothetical protein JXR80_11845 [Deltaproteobacteria bacterium]|nr:hypothetical protein [Deltaproteobacteria bacterium]
MFKKIFLLLVAVAIIVGGVVAFQMIEKQHNLVITFADAKHLMVDDHVYLAGALAGKVKAVEAKNKQVAVTINLKKTFYDQITANSAFFIDNDALNQKRKCLLIRLASEPGQPLTPGTQLKGVDSDFAWSARKAGEEIAARMGAAMQEMLNSEAVQKSSDDLTKLWQDIRQAFNDIDLKKMEQELREKTESLRRSFDKALPSAELKQTMAEIEKKLAELQQTLKEAGNSEAAQQLKKTLEELFKKLEKEAPPAKRDVKI